MAIKKGHGPTQLGLRRGIQRYPAERCGLTGLGLQGWDRGWDGFCHPIKMKGTIGLSVGT